MAEYSNIHLRNANIQSIVQQNEELRRHLQKTKQSEQLISELLLKVELSKTREVELVTLNAELDSQLRSLQLLTEERERAYTEEMQYVFAQHDKILIAKEQEVKYSRTELAKVAERTRELDELARTHQDRERQLTQRYEAELAKYKSRILEFEGELEKVYRNAEGEKYSFEKARSVWTAEKESLVLELSQLTNTIKKFESDNLLLIEYSKELESNLIKTEEQNRATLVTLREKLIQQEEEVQHFLYLKKDLESSNQIITRELEELKRLQAHISNDNQSLLLENEKIINLLTESDKESKYLRSQITELELALNKVSEMKEDELRDLKNENLEILRSKTEVDSYISSKIAELRQLSAATNNLQTLVNKQEAHISSLTTSLNDAEETLAKEKKKGADYLIQIRSLTDNANISKQQSSQLRQINSKLQLQIEELSQEALCLAKTAVLPKDINKEFIDQMNKMLLKFREERDEQNRYHILEKEKLRERYEFQLKQVELDLLKKIAMLEEQLSISKKCEILAERSNSIYTFTSKY